MLSRRFLAWVGVGVISAATIPTLAAPQLAKLASRKPPAKTATVTKTPTKAAAAAKLTAGVKTTGKTPVKTALKTSKKPTVKSAALAHHTPVSASSKKLATVRTLSKATTPESGRLAARHADAVAKMDLSGPKTSTAHKPVASPKMLAHKPSASATAKKLLH
jgi:hypothetical protein